MIKYLTIIHFLLTINAALAQVDDDSDLFKIISSNDSLLFNVGFNTCDMAQFELLLSDRFEFIHDKEGVLSKQEFLTSMRNGLCNSPTTYLSRRALISGSTEIYPLYKGKRLYGAIQTGNHRFYETIANGNESYASSARFTHVWTLENEVWKLTKGLSYDHQDTDVANFRSAMFDNDVEIEKWLKELNVPTLGIGVIKDGKLNQVKVFGELQGGVAAPYNTIFNVASLTKPITAIVTLKLVSSGQWDLDEPIHSYWTDPDVAGDLNSKILTTRHVLSHQSGFTNWRGDNPDGKLHFEFIPGTKYQYSGEGYEYLRNALEHKFKKTLDQLASELIMEPLAMTDTRFFWDERIDSTRFAIGYNSQAIPYKTIKRRSANAADDLLTTVEDYGNFLVSVLNGDGMSAKVYDAMVSHQVATKTDKYFGLGFEIYDLGNGEYALSHGGADKGCQTIVFIFPKTGQGLLIFTNVDDGYKVYETLLTHYLGEYGRRIADIETK
ncbi:MAG: class A beta-lactamase-related serine hydrolase [Flavobacteriales bacterium]|nr:class A beta-lactamase-related serine hydrolase [Flavobacteriales bacterium]